MGTTKPDGCSPPEISVAGAPDELGMRRRAWNINITEPQCDLAVGRIMVNEARIDRLSNETWISSRLSPIGLRRLRGCRSRA